MIAGARAPTDRRRDRDRDRALRAGGFTLIEVLVALAVFAIAVTALVQAGGRRAEDLGYLRDRTLGAWIAADRITELRLEPEWPPTGTRDGEIEMARREWHWEADIERTPNEDIRRVEVTVSIDGRSIAHATGFIGDPALGPARGAEAGDGGLTP